MCQLSSILTGDLPFLGGVGGGGGVLKDDPMLYASLATVVAVPIGSWHLISHL